MPTKEMLVLLNTLESIKASRSVGSINGVGVGFLTSDEVGVLNGIASREGALGSIMTDLLEVLSVPEGHPDLSSTLADIAGVFLAWSINASQPLEQKRFHPGDKVRVRFPGKALIYLGTIVEQEGETMVALPLLGEVVAMDKVHIQERVAKEKPRASEVAAFQKLLEGQLEEIIQQVQSD